MGEYRRREPMTPHEIRNAELPRIGRRRTYQPDAVHELLWRLAEETAARDAVIAEQAARLNRVERELYARRHGALPAAAGAPNLDELLAEVDERAKAQRYADEVIATAQHGAAQIVSQGKRQAQQVLMDAHRAAEQAAHDYRAAAGADYQPEQEQLERVVAISQWAIRQLAALREQVNATGSVVTTELSDVVARLQPAVTNGRRLDSAAARPDA